MTILLAATALPVGGVNVNGGSPGAASFFPAPAAVSYELTSAGIERAIINGSPTQLGDFPAGVGLEARLTWSGSTLDGGSAATGSWLALSTTRTWTYTQSGVGSKSGSGTIDIRNSAGTIVASAAVSMTAEVEP